MSFYEFKPENFETMGELCEKVKEIHEQLFPKATFLSQAAKFEEEAEEQLQTISKSVESINELADMIIVGCGILRFSYRLGQCLIGGCINGLMHDDFLMSAILKAVCDKMNINQERKWGDNEGYYKHISTVN